MSVGVSNAQQYDVVATDFFVHGSATTETNKTAVFDEAKDTKDLMHSRIFTDQANQLWFQINSDRKGSTGGQILPTSDRSIVTRLGRAAPSAWTVLETALILLVFSAVAGQLPPDVNESHYLTKAKHFWNPAWCPNDLFLSSSFSHWLFYIAFGWLSKFLSLSAFAWVGRILTWTALALAWQRLSRSVIQLRMFSVLSAMFFLLLNERFHLAGEWVVGGFEGKGLAYAFVILALAKLGEKKWHQVWPLLGIASLFHVLVGGWALLAAAFSFVLCMKPKSGSTIPVAAISDHARTHWKSILITAGLIIAAALPPLLADHDASAAETAMAHSIYVNVRISHHLTFSAFPADRVARFSLLLLFGTWLTFWIKKDSKSLSRRLQPFVWFAVGTLIISYSGLLLSGFAEQNDWASTRAAGLLRFYWFRIADFAIPAVLSLACCLVLSKWLVFGQRKFHRNMPFVFAAIITVATGLMIFENYSDARPVADRTLPTYEGSKKRTIDTWQNWRKVCRWIQTNTPTDAVFITPAQQQTFKWYAHRTEIVAWKDVPQDAANIIEWRQRIATLHNPQLQFANGLLRYTDEQLLDLAKHYQATHLLIPQYQVDATLEETKLNQIYPTDPNEKSTYVVFALTRPED